MSVEDLADRCVLAELLAKRASAARGSVTVAFASGSHVATASAGAVRADERWPIGCVAKLLTATLVRRAARRDVLELDTEIAPLLGADGAALGGVTVRQLLEHTHGLDDSLLALPRYAHGRIDRAELVRHVSKLERFARPGAAYSYGHVGAWLAAAILERLLDRALAALVHAELLQPLELDALRLQPSAVPLCAAGGAGLELTASELARFALFALTNDGSLTAEPITPLPGWHPLERGICMAWKYAGAGWFGHQSVWPRASIYLRAQPERRVALAVIASDEPAALVALGVFGSRLPELFEWQAVPPPHDERASDAPGVYAQAARTIVIAQGPHGLEAETWARDERGARRGVPAHASLVPARGVLFGRPAREHLPYAELVTSESGERWLWNGRCILRRA